MNLAKATKTSFGTPIRFGSLARRKLHADMQIVKYFIFRCAQFRFSSKDFKKSTTFPEYQQ